MENEFDNNENIPDIPAIEENLWYYKSIDNFYDRVRSSLNVGNSMSDTMIDYPENAPLAEERIKRMVPNYEELDQYKKLLFDTCIVYQTCYSLCPIASSMIIKRQKDPSLEIEFSENKTSSNGCERFLYMIEDLISQIEGDEKSTYFGFRVTGGEKNVCFPCIIHSRNAFDPL